MGVAVKTMNEDDVDKSPTDGGKDLGEAETTDLWSARGCLEKVNTSWEVSIFWLMGSGNLPSSPYKQRH